MPAVTIDLPNELEQRLQRRAAAEGLGVAEAALKIIAEELQGSQVASPNELPYEVWRNEFEAWIRSVPQMNPGSVDDSRESIYQGRGE